MFTTSTIVAAICFSTAGFFMKLSHGLTVLVPTVATFALVLSGTVAQTLAMRHQDMTMTYVVVLGLEAVAAMALGAFLLDERPTTLRLAGTGLVVAGILLLHASSS